MKKVFAFLLGINSVFIFSQEKIDNLQYAKTLIKVPEKCVAKSEFEILNCYGFSAQWLFLNEEMVKQNVDKQIFSQLESQIKFKTKRPIEFISQQQSFVGNIYTLKNNSVRIIGFGRINEMPLVLNLGLKKEPKNNADLSDFEKQFIIIK